MKLIFNNKAEDLRKEYPFSQTIHFPQKGPWSLNGKSCKSAEVWLETAKALMRAMGMEDCAYVIFENKKKETQPPISFYFKRELDLIRFLVMTLGNTKGNFQRTIKCDSAEIADHIEAGIHSFTERESISAGVRRVAPYKILITTSCRFDDAAIFSHYAQGKFDNSPKTQTAIADRLPFLALDYTNK